MKPLAISRGAAMADILLLIENDRADAHKLSSSYVARTQSRSLYAWTWRREDGQAVICAGMHQARPGVLERLETWFTCRPDLSMQELHEFVLFARLVVWCVWRERKPVELIAWVTGVRSAGARIAKLIGFTLEAEDTGGQRRVVFNPGEEPCHG